MKIRVLVYLVTVFCVGCSLDFDKKEFYASGEVLSTYSVDSLGRKNGVCVEYFQNGNWKSVERFESGDLNGEQTYYYDDNNVKSVFIYKEGVLIDSSLHYINENDRYFLNKINYYSKYGRVIDFKVYDSDGNRSFEQVNKRVLFNAEKDTITYGDTWTTYMHIANSEFDSVLMILVVCDQFNDVNDLDSLFMNSDEYLKNITYNQVELDVKNYKLGFNKVCGIAFEYTFDGVNTIYSPLFFKTGFWVLPPASASEKVSK